MALLDLVKYRKSVRDFLDVPVEREKIMMCLEAARLLEQEQIRLEFLEEVLVT